MADASVRPARPDDVPEIARIQVTTWRTAYAPILPADALTALTAELAEARWNEALTAPPSPQHRVLVAEEGSQLVGFVAVEPAEEPDTAAIATMLVEPRWGRRGHGSRMLAATVQQARQDGTGQLISWVIERDAASTAFLRSAGWAPDGWTRTLDMTGTPVREVRLHTSLDESA